MNLNNEIYNKKKIVSLPCVDICAVPNKPVRSCAIQSSNGPFTKAKACLTIIASSSSLSTSRNIFMTFNGTSIDALFIHSLKEASTLSYSSLISLDSKGCFIADSFNAAAMLTRAWSNLTSLNTRERRRREEKRREEKRREEKRREVREGRREM